MRSAKIRTIHSSACRRFTHLINSFEWHSMKCEVAIIRVMVRSVLTLSSFYLTATTCIYLPFFVLLSLLLVLLFLMFVLSCFTRCYSAALLASNKIRSTSITRVSKCVHALFCEGSNCELDSHCLLNDYYVTFVDTSFLVSMSLS